MDNPLKGFPWRELPLAIAYRLSRDELIDVRDDGVSKTFVLNLFNVHFTVRRCDKPNYEIEIVAQTHDGRAIVVCVSPEGDDSAEARAAGEFVTAAIAQIILERKKSTAAMLLNEKSLFRAICKDSSRPIIPESYEDAFLAGIADFPNEPEPEEDTNA